MRMMPGGGRRYNEDTVNMAIFMGVLILILFFALVIRSFFDGTEGAPTLGPVRNPSRLIQSMLGEK